MVDERYVAAHPIWFRFADIGPGHCLDELQNIAAGRFDFLNRENGHDAFRHALSFFCS
jgi:hypothetical protein